MGHRNLRGDGGVGGGREDAEKARTHTGHSDRSGDEGRMEQTNFTARGTAVVDRMPALRMCAAPQRSRSPIGRLLHYGVSEQSISCRCCARAVLERPIQR